jgi:erythromycin esterase
MVRMLSQLVDTHITPGYDITDSTSGLVKRDRYMAENIAALLAASPPGTKMVVASHNEHVRRDPYNMGYFLGQRFGKAYYAFALAFGEGDFQALAVGEKGTPLRSFTVGPGFQQSTEWMLARSRPGSYFVDFRPLVRTGSEQSWFTKPRALRSIGNGYAPGNPSGYYRAPVTPGNSYDGIVFIRHTTRAKPNPSVRR